MAVLHNRVSQLELKEKLLSESVSRKTISFYKYFLVPDPSQLRDELYTNLNALAVFGRIYLALEGINAQISIPENNWEAVKAYLFSFDFFKDLRLNTAIDDDGKSFWVLKIKVREKIVADGIKDPLFRMDKKGKYVNAEAFNRLSDDPETIVVDMRNHYEYEVGHFEGAIEIPSDTFRDQLPMAVEMLADAKDKNIIIYCTGGIRCEKASAYLLHRGFKNVFHLEGGIIHYTHQVKQQHLPLKFHGKNFVFDNRLGERITEEIISKCHQCGGRADTHVNCANDGCHLLFIQCDDCRTKMKVCCSQECFEIMQLPAEEQKKIRKGIDKGRNVFNKSKKRLRPRLKEPRD
ncbi:MAG: rhodanese-related sulfurtransferase [Flavisolibacter sp.]